MPTQRVSNRDFLYQPYSPTTTRNSLKSTPFPTSLRYPDNNQKQNVWKYL